MLDGLSLTTQALIWISIVNYKTTRSPAGVKSVFYDVDNVRVSFVDPTPGHYEYEKYLAWLAEGNTPEEWSPDAS